MRKKITIIILVIALTAVFSVFLGPYGKYLLTSVTNGTILADIDGVAYQHAWGENVGWINFGTSKSEVHVTDSELTGYAWGENTGWISLNCSNTSTCGTVDYKVSNSAAGSVTGYAWGENVGWVNFNPTGGGVSINSSGEFTGYPWGENTGWISLNCLNTSTCGTVNYKVKTDWRPQSARDEVAAVPTVVGGGGGFSITKPTTTTGEITPKETLTEKIPEKETDRKTDRKKKVLPPEQPSEQPDKKETPQKEPQSIIPVTPLVTQEIPEEKPFLEKIPIIGKIAELLNPPKQLPEPQLLIPIEKLVSKKTPPAFQSDWHLIPANPIKKFALAPLPEEMIILAQKFPEIGKTLSAVGISKLTDLERLMATKLVLPGLTQRVSTLPSTDIHVGKFALSPGLPLAKFTPKMKQQMPSEIVFAKGGNELIDLNIVLTVTEKGDVQQRITTIAGKPMEMMVKPDQPVKRVKGYIVLRGKRKTSNATSLEDASPWLGLKDYNLKDLSASVLFADPSFSKPHEEPLNIEKRLVLLEFEYMDSDGDGIYTANIQMPVVEGEYEIITVMDYKNPALGSKEIRLITVVDPEGYIYEKTGEKETRIPGAIVSIYWLNTQTKQYELWSAKEFQQENPQITDNTGRYSFLVPEGAYHIKVEAPGYPLYEGKAFSVTVGNGVHENIELKTKYWWLHALDWKTILLIIVVLLTIYNFYKIRRRSLRQKFINN